MEGFYVILSNESEKVFSFLVRVVKSRRNSYTVSVIPVRKSIDESIESSLKDSKRCLFINIYDYGDEKEASIINFSYERFCVISPGLDKSEGRFMINPTLEFCRSMFNISKFTFADSSSFICKSIEKNISMGKHNLLVYGQTWYERLFNAYPIDEDDQRSLRITKFILSEKVDVKKAKLVMKFIDKYHAELIFLDDEIRNEFSTIVSSSINTKSWNDMFQDVNNISNKRGCEFFTNVTIDYIFEILDLKFKLLWELDIGSDQDKYLYSFEKIHT